jgi:hypothetical protein
MGSEIQRWVPAAAQRRLQTEQPHQQGNVAVRPQPAGICTHHDLYLHGKQLTLSQSGNLHTSYILATY